MPKWVSGFDRQPIKYQMYFVKYNGEKQLLRLDEFWRKLDTAQTFYWLDESEEIKDVLEKISSIDQFVKTDRVLISQEILTPYEPKIHRSEIMKIFRIYYLKQISALRKQIGELTKEVGRQKINGNYVPSTKKDPLLERIKKLNDSSFFDIEK